MDIEKAFDAFAIRDTAEHIGIEHYSGEFIAKTICVMNTLDQAVDFVLEGSCIASVWMPIGNGWTQGANSNGYQTVSTYFPHYRIKAQCGVSPTSGVLDVVMIKTKG